MPIVALPVLLGGVSGGEFARMSLLLLNTMLLSLCVGIGVSTVCRDEKRSRGMAFLWMALLCGGFPLAGAWLDAEFKLRGLGECLFFPSPGYAFSQAWDATRAGGGGHYWTSMLVIHGVTWLFLLVGCWFAPRTWQDQAMKETGWWQRFRRWVSGIEGEGARAFRTRLLERNAFLWLATRPRFRPAMLWLVLAALTALWLGFGMKYPRDMFHPTMFVFMALAWNGILKVGIASEASRQIASDRKSGSIELLLSTPLSTRDIQRGSWLALQRQFGLPILTVVVAECLLLVLGAHEIRQEDDRRVWIVIWISGLCMLMADVAALHIVGLWHSAVAKGPTEAAGATAFRILALPWILYMLLGAAVALTDGLGIFRGLNLGWEFWLASYVVLGFGVDLLFGLKARNAMRTHFREMAAQRMAPRGWGAVLGRMFGRATARRLPAR
jgi:hypothetical protein